MSLRQHAAALAAEGFRVFRLPPGSKNPYTRETHPDAPDDLLKWADNATSDPAEALSLWTGPDGGSTNDNVGVLADGLAVIDCDVKSGVDGIAAFNTLAPYRPPTRTVLTPSGGKHFYYRTTVAFGQKPLARGIDVRCGNGYVVGPGSIVNGKTYVVEDAAPVADVPDSVADKLAIRMLAPSTSSVMVKDRDAPDVLRAAQRYVAVHAPEAVQGERTNTSYEVAARLFDFGVSEPTAMDLLSRWNETKCHPLMSPSEIRKQVESALRYRTRPIGIDAPTLGFKPLPPLPETGPGLRGPLLRFPRELSVEGIRAAEAGAILQGAIYPSSDVWFYGQSGSGKSFVAIDMAFRIARGLNWCGRRTVRSPVLYIGLEGENGLRKRILAATQRHGDPGSFFAEILVPPFLGAEGGEAGEKLISEAVRQLRAAAGTDRPGLIVVDTFARATAGDDENSADSAARFVRRLQSIHGATGWATMTIHHPSKESGDMRGSGVFRAAADAIFKVERKKGDGPFSRALSFEKMKDGRDGESFDFELQQVVLAEGTPDHPEQITSCVVDYSERNAELVSLADEVRTAVRTAIEKGERVSPKPKSPNSVAKVFERHRPNFGAEMPEPAEIWGAWMRIAHEFELVAYKSGGRPCTRLAIKDG